MRGDPTGARPRTGAPSRFRRPSRAGARWRRLGAASVLALAAVALGWPAAPPAPGGPTPAAGQPAGVTVNPAMARGPADAPVTIVEFSDYQ